MTVTVLSDLFTHTDSALSLGSATVAGGAWTVGNLGDVASLPTWGIDSNRGYLVVGGSGTHRHAWLEAGVSDGTLSLAVTTSNPINGTQGGILFRRVDENNFWFAHINNSTDLVEVRVFSGGAGGIISSVAGPSMGAGDTVTLSVDLSGAHIRVSVGATVYIEAESQVNEHGTKHGLYQASASGGVNLRYDTFLMTTASQVSGGQATVETQRGDAVGTLAGG